MSKDHLLEKIANHLMINSSFLLEPGLLRGKMGIVLFFAHYSRYTSNSIYEEFAGELIDEVQGEINHDIPINFDRGLCGIGWVIEYLLQNNFMEGNSNDVLLDIDNKIMERDLSRITDKSFLTGLEGISCYISERINSISHPPLEMPFDCNYLTDWQNVVGVIPYPDKNKVLSLLLNKIPEGNDYLNWNLGLENGCAGKGLKIILQ